MDVKNLQYYENSDKMFWVPTQDIKTTDKNFIKRNMPIPCIFVEEKCDKYYILQIDLSIKIDKYRYTAWRKVIGITYGIRVDVLLICNNNLYKLNGEKVCFEYLGRSDVNVDKQYLGKFDIKNNLYC